MRNNTVVNNLLTQSHLLGPLLNFSHGNHNKPCEKFALKLIYVQNTLKGYLACREKMWVIKSALSF